MKDGAKLVLSYLFFVLLYGAVVSLFSSTVHIDVDEELYLQMARSFHYQGQFMKDGELVNYSAVLYSMLISLAYYVYDAESLLFMMRMIGVAAMMSSIFPIWLLASSMLENKKTAFRLTLLSMFMPYMFDCAYLMQEVLAYPLFLWVLYWFSRMVGKPDHGGKSPVLCACFSVLCLFTKTYLFFIPICINLAVLAPVLKGTLMKSDPGMAAGPDGHPCPESAVCRAWKKREGWRPQARRLLLYDFAYGLCAGGMLLAVRMVNGVSEGSNHYSSQFARLFPIDLITLLCGASCCIFYCAFLCVNTGFLPTVMLAQKAKDTSGGERCFWQFNLLSLLFLIAEIVFMIVLTEEGKVWYPRKYCFRYFQIFTVPMLIAFSSKFMEFRFKKKERAFCFLMMAAAAAYWAVKGQAASHGVMDSHLFVLLENAGRIIPYAGAVLTILFYGAAMAGLRWKQAGKRVFLCIVAGFWALNCFQLPYYSNIIAGGRSIEKDSIVIADYFDASTIQKIYYVNGGGRKRLPEKLPRIFHPALPGHRTGTVIGNTEGWEKCCHYPQEC